MQEINRQQLSSEWDSFTGERYLQMIKYASGRNYVLDVGCNTGRGGAFLKKHFPSMIIDGIDIIQERIDKIPAGIYRNVYCDYIEKVDLAEQSYDVIIAGEFIEHVHKENLIILLQKFKKMLRQGGSVVFTTPNPRSILVRLGRNGVLQEKSHVNIMRVNELQSLMISAGYRITHLKGSGKMSRYLGQNLPFMALYGSYLISAIPESQDV